MATKKETKVDFFGSSVAGRETFSSDFEAGLPDGLFSNKKSQFG
jgi:hypothetical protein